MAKADATWSFSYDFDGLRTGRTDGSKTYQYVYSGTALTQMTVDGNTLQFTYDASGVPQTVNWNGTTYYYLTNLQGDVMGILDSAGHSVVMYTYDAWGKPLSVSDTLAATLGTLNPLRYRGYVYDTETELYYLQSRYYDPNICRFLNADGYASTGQGLTGNNMFAYCGNNPVTRIDPTGHSWDSFLDFCGDLWNTCRDLWNFTFGCFTDPIYAQFDYCTSSIWSLGAQVFSANGYRLTSELLSLSAAGSHYKYKAGPSSYAANLLASDYGFVSAVQSTYKKQKTSGSHEFPVAQGDLGAALHNVNYSIHPFPSGYKTPPKRLFVTVTDTFDFTEFKNPFAQDSFISGVLWLCNDAAVISQMWGILDPVPVQITLIIPVAP